MAGRNDKPGFIERTVGQIAPSLGKRGREERAKKEGAIAKFHRGRTDDAIDRMSNGKPPKR